MHGKHGEKLFKTGRYSGIARISDQILGKRTTAESGTGSRNLQKIHAPQLRREHVLRNGQDGGVEGIRTLETVSRLHP
jgi:hypothetical protein